MKTAEEFIREKIREKQGIKGQMDALWKYHVSGDDCLRWAHDFASQFKPKWVTDDEIIKETSDWNPGEATAEAFYFEIGAKWMRDQLIPQPLTPPED